MPTHSASFRPPVRGSTCTAGDSTGEGASHDSAGSASKRTSSTSGNPSSPPKTSSRDALAGKGTMEAVPAAPSTASIVPFPASASRELVFGGDDGLPDVDDVRFDADPAEWDAPSPVESPACTSTRTGGRKLALCVGIDHYAGATDA